MHGDRGIEPEPLPYTIDLPVNTIIRLKSLAREKRKSVTRWLSDLVYDIWVKELKEKKCQN